MSVKKQAPVPLSFNVASGMVKELGSLKYFPAGNDAAGLAIVRLVAGMCEYEHQLRWLIDRMTSGALYTEWPGPRELRAVYCSKFKPKDGIEIGSLVYLEGVPSESGRQEFQPIPLSPMQERKLLADFLDVDMKALSEPKRGENPSKPDQTHGATRDESAQVELGREPKKSVASEQSQAVVYGLKEGE